MKPDHPAVHACRFITQRRFDGFGELERAPKPVADLGGKFYARCESGELAAWDRHMKASHGRGLPRDRAGGWLVASRWPPGDPRAVACEVSTAPALPLPALRGERVEVRGDSTNAEPSTRRDTPSPQPSPPEGGEGAPAPHAIT